MAPTLYSVSIYFNAMVARWHYQCDVAGVTVLYKHGSKLVEDCTAKSRLLKVNVSESQFADDAALYAVTWAASESVGRSFVHVASQYGLTVSLSKIKGLVIMYASGEDGILCKYMLRR